MSEWFPMSTARLVRDRRYVELRLDNARWLEFIDGEDPDFGACLQQDSDGTSFVVGYWWPDEERSWWLCESANLAAHHGYGAIDDDFSGWRNLPPIYPEGYGPSPPLSDEGTKE